MRQKNIKSIHQELVNIVYGFFRDEATFNVKTQTEKYEIVFDTSGFLFEDYREDFDNLISQMYSNDFDEEHLRIERTLFITGCTQHALQRLKEREVMLEKDPIYKGQ